jgi:hypothetical protein
MKFFPAKKQLASDPSLALLVFLLLAGLLEGLARAPGIERSLPHRSHGITYPQFDIKWFRLEDYASHMGGLDAVVLGNSMAATGVDPAILGEAYTARTGEPLRAFNFGLDGITPQGSLEIAKVLFQTQQPEVLVYVVDVRIFDSNLSNNDVDMLETPWFRARSGDWNLPGWGFDQSLALQRYLPYRNWMRADFPQNFSLYVDRDRSMRIDGYEEEYFSAGFDRTLEPGDEAYARCMDYYPNRFLDPAYLDALQGLIAFGQEHEAQTVVAEMPVHPFVYECMGGEQAYLEFQERLREAVEKAGGVFLPALPEGIPLEGYSDLIHLNVAGAPLFSRYLGERLAELDNEAGARP